MVTALIFKTFLGGMIVGLCSYLAARSPELAGFIVALPLISLVVLVFAYTENGEAATVSLAKNIFWGVPISTLFFVPFLFSEKLNLPFWPSFVLGLLCIGVGYYAQKILTPVP